jgi:DNA transformation protein
MRNAKVRRRIAAGKLKLRIRDLRNLGPRSEELLAQVGIRSADGLRRRGAVEAYLALRRIGATRSLNMLWAMVGALDPWPEGRDWREVAASERRLPLLLAVDDPSSAVPLAARRLSRAGRSASVGRRVGRTPPSPLGNWAPGLPFDDDPAAADAGSGDRAGHPEAAEPPSLASGGAPDGRRPEPKSRPKAGS